MKLESLKCPSCGAIYNPSKIQCEYCHSYIIMSNDKYSDYNNEVFEEDSASFSGIYVYGSLLGKGEKPISFGVANYFKSKLYNVGGKLLLTNKSLSFSSHKFMQGKTDVKIMLSDIVSAYVKSNMLISQTIGVTTSDKEYCFVVYHGQEWVENILNSRNNINDKSNTNKNNNDDYIAELEKLKKLLDDGIITQEEFDLKKRMILKI